MDWNVIAPVVIGSGATIVTLLINKIFADPAVKAQIKKDATDAALEVVETLQEEVKSLRAEVVTLRTENATLKGRVAHLEKENDTLRANGTGKRGRRGFGG